MSSAPSNPGPAKAMAPVANQVEMGLSGVELERRRAMAEHRFQAVTDYQLQVMAGPAKEGH